MCLLVCLSNMFVPDYFLSNFHLAFYHLIGWILVFLSNSLLCSCICSLLNWFLTPLVSVLKYFFLSWSICLYNSCLDPLVYIVLFMSSLKIFHDLRQYNMYCVFIQSYRPVWTTRCRVDPARFMQQIYPCKVTVFEIFWI